MITITTWEIALLLTLCFYAFWSVVPEQFGKDVVRVLALIGTALVWVCWLLLSLWQGGAL